MPKLRAALALALALAAALAAATAADAKRIPVYRSPHYRGIRHIGSLVAKPPPPPITLGTGDAPDVLVDAAGTAHIVWREEPAGGPDQIHYCRLPRGARACAAQALLPVPQADSDPQTNGDSDGPRILEIGRQLLVVDRRYPNVVPVPGSCDPLPCTSDSNVYLLTSDDGGQTFTGPGVIGNNQMDGGAVVFGADAPFVGTFGGASFSKSLSGPPGVAFQATHAGQYTQAFALLAPAGHPVGAAVDPRGERPVVAYGDDNGHLVVREWSGQGDPNDAAQWSATSYDAQGGAIAAGPRGPYAIVDPPSGPVAVHAVASGPGAGAPVFKSFETNEIRLLEDPSGGLRALGTTLNNSGLAEDAKPRRLLSSTSADGASFTTPQVIAQAGPAGTDGFYDPALAAASDGGGFAVWSSGETGHIQATGFGAATPTGQPGLGGLPGGGAGGDQGGFVACQKIHFGDIDALASAGCFLHERGDTSGAGVTDGELRLNGVQIIPDAGAKVRIDPHKHTIDSVGTVKVDLRIPEVGDITLWHGELHVKLSDAGAGQTLFDFDTSQFPVDLEGFPIQGRIDVILGHDSVTVPIALKLPPYMGGISGEATLRANNADGLILDSLHVSVQNLILGALEVKSLDVSYTRQGEVWAGHATLSVPPDTDEFAITADVRFEHGDLTLAAFDISSYPGIPIYADAYLHSFGGGFDLHPPKRIFGDVEVGAIPLDPPNYAITVDGGFKITFGDDGAPTKVEVTGTGAIRGEQIAQAHLLFQTNGFFEMDGSLDLDLAVAEVSGGVKAFVDLPAGLFSGDIHGDVKVLGYDIGSAEALVSSRGIGACGSVKIPLPIAAGVFYDWGGDAHTMWGSCDLSPYAVVPVSGPRVRAGSAARIAASAGVTVPAGAPVEDIEVDGTGAAPSVVLTDPHGQQIVPSTSDPNAPALAIPAQAYGRTIVVLRKPLAGAWQVNAAPGSVPVTQVSAASGLPAPVVRARVTGHGAHRRLAYGATSRRNLSVRFAERAAGVFHVIGTARGARGTLRFTPAPGPGGSRQIVAIVDENGLPRERPLVASYVAPAPARPGRVRGLRVRRSGGRFAIHIGSARGATRYLVRIHASDGRRLVRVVGAGRPSLSVRVLGYHDALTVAVQGISPTGQRGSTAQARTGRVGRGG